MPRTLPSIGKSIPCYSDNWHSMAVPRRIQCSGGCNDGSQIAMTKLVEWPVVDSTPFRSVVLYTGHVYVSLSCTCSFVTGVSQIWKYKAWEWARSPREDAAAFRGWHLKPRRSIKSSDGQEKHVAFLEMFQRVFRRKLRPFTEKFLNYLSTARKALNLVEEIELFFVLTYVRHGIVKNLWQGFIELHCGHIEASSVKK